MKSKSDATKTLTLYMSMMLKKSSVNFNTAEMNFT